MEARSLVARMMLSWSARRRTPLRMAPPPRQEGREGLTPVRRLCTRKASTSSRVLRLDTRLGEISWRDLVRVAKASSPETARPGGLCFRSILEIYY